MKGWNWFPLRVLGCILVGCLIGIMIGWGWGLITYFFMFLIEYSKAEAEHDEMMAKEKEEDYYV